LIPPPMPPLIIVPRHHPHYPFHRR
jgi:hypothetical protein